MLRLASALSTAQVPLLEGLYAVDVLGHLALALKGAIGCALGCGVADSNSTLEGAGALLDGWEDLHSRAGSCDDLVSSLASQFHGRSVVLGTEVISGLAAKALVVEVVMDVNILRLLGRVDSD